MQIWQDEDEFTQEQNGGCCGLSAVDDARRVADWLEIPYYVMNFKSEFRKNVMDYFTAEYLKGRTPNPCIACNRYVKWEALLERSMAIGADYIATGHYARVEQLSDGRYAIKNSVTALKDQTYALYNLTQEQLKRTLMPVGDYTKDEIRAIAEEAGLMVAHKTVWKSALSRMMIMPDLLTGSAMDRFRLLVILFLLMVRFWEDTRESPITRSDSEKVLELHLDIRCL